MPVGRATLSGRPSPLGATCVPEGVNFCVFSKNAERVQLLLFAGPDDPAPATVVDLDRRANRTSYYWHVLVPGAGPGQVYAWRVHGPFDPGRGLLFDGDKVLLDPYGLAVTGLDGYDRAAACRPGDNCPTALRSVVVDPAAYDWEGDVPLPPPDGRETIYEMHLGGFTASPTSGLPEHLRGTYAGLAARIPYLSDLGVTAVELMPIHHFDPQDAPGGRTNVWGYSSLSFFAPHAPYSSDRSPLGPVDEFRDMVKALHRAGLRVILDVVYNHTAEGGPDGPTLCWRGFENIAYYHQKPGFAGYADYTGCGNTVNANHSIVRRMIMSSLRYWVKEMHVDGFRFDLASALSRGEDGTPQDKAPILWAIGSDPELVGTRLIAEAWDAAGLYQVGSFAGDGFAEWNGAFRDDVRSFLRGDPGTIERLMARIVGSPDLLPPPDHGPFDSINYVTCHDGFTLADLVAYDRKHNEANGENNRDGADVNLSWNCGVEGPTDDPAVLALRERQMRNFLCLLLLSHGTPMITMGDEVGHTRGGNNNPWCLDNDLNRLDWDKVPGSPLLDFTRGLIALANRVTILQRNRFWTATSSERRGEISWHGLKPGKPDWTEESRVLAYELAHPDHPEALLVLMNSGPEAARFSLPPAPGGLTWRKVVDTAAEPGRNPVPLRKEDKGAAAAEKVPGHSIAVFLATAPGP
ncbi:MAG: glycogen debranching protein GlgX [Candidatus Krumholzibacteriia bacterium]